MNKNEYIIVGAGLTGLAIAKVLQEAGKSFLIIEAEDRPGGRVKTDMVDGFRLDRGFQVYLTAYPEGLQQLDLKELDLKPFLPGAKILMPNGAIDMFVDPIRKLKYLFTTLKSDVGDFGDKLSLFSLSRRLINKRNKALFQRENKDTSSVLKEYGIGENIIQHFLHPFFSGIFLESELSTSRQMFDFIFKMFSKGDGAVPKLGMEQIPIQMASKIPSESFLFNSRVVDILEGGVVVEDGQVIHGDTIIVATEAGSLLEKVKPDAKLASESVTCVYFSAQTAPYSEPIIALNSSPERLVNNIAVLSNVSSEYAPKGQSLISVSINGVGHQSTDLVSNIKSEMRKWFGDKVESWNHLKTYEIPYALPNQRIVRYDLDIQESKVKDKLYVCGDHLLQGSINGAMKAGRKLGEYLVSQ